MWKNLENFSKSIQFLICESEVWTCNLMITSLVSYPLDHRGKLENFADYVCFIIKIWKSPLLANKMYKLQTHFGFTNPWSKVLSFWARSSQKVKNASGTPCTCLKLSYIEVALHQFALPSFRQNWEIIIIEIMHCPT